MNTTLFDQAKSEVFAGRMLGMINESSLALMLSIGHQTGLFNTMDGLQPSTHKKIADAAGLNERYVREWLGAMVVGKILEYDAETENYWLPAEHAASLAQSAGERNMAPLMQFIPVLAKVEKEIVECFYNGGGVPYKAFPGFHHAMADSNRAAQDQNLIDRALPLVPGLTERLKKGINVADLGCGQGHITNLLAQAFPKSQFVGYDFVSDNVKTGNQEAKKLGLKNIKFVKKDVATLEQESKFDLITAFDAIHDQAKPAEVLKRIERSLKPKGVFLMMDIAASSHLHENHDHFLGPFLYTVSCMHCMTVSLSQEGAGLGAMWGEQVAQQMLSDANFKDIEVKKSDVDPINNYYVAYK